MRQGATLVLADRQLSLAEDVAHAIGVGASAAMLDVRDLDAFRALADRVRAGHGRIDLLFNNAGIGVGSETHTFDAVDWDDVMDVNVRGITNGIVACNPQMIIVHPRWWRALWWLERISPRASFALWEHLLGEIRRETKAT